MFVLAYNLFRKCFPYFWVVWALEKVGQSKTIFHWAEKILLLTHKTFSAIFKFKRHKLKKKYRKNLQKDHSTFKTIFKPSKGPKYSRILKKKKIKIKIPLKISLKKMPNKTSKITKIPFKMSNMTKIHSKPPNTQMPLKTFIMTKLPLKLLKRQKCPFKTSKMSF